MLIQLLVTDRFYLVSLRLQSLRFLLAHRLILLVSSVVMVAGEVADHNLLWRVLSR